MKLISFIQKNIKKFKKEEEQYFVDFYDYTSGKYQIVRMIKFTFKNIKFTIDINKLYENKKWEVIRETRLFYNNKEVELNKNNAYKLLFLTNQKQK